MTQLSNNERDASRLATPASRPSVASPSVACASGPLDPGTRIGDWRIERIIGRGGMGTVYEAIHTVIGKRAAIKVVRADLAERSGERTVQEALFVNQIGHANIVDIFEIGRLDDQRPYLIMEYLHGENLGDRMAHGRVPASEAIDVLLDIAAALSAAHQHGIVHRDLKPDNVFLADAPGGGVTVKVVDWGIAKRVVGDATPPTTLTGTLIGTPEYMSPEQARGQEVDGRSDVYALGVIAYELFLEAPPFVADNVADLLAMHLTALPPPPREVWPEIPDALDALLRGLLAKDAADRPALVHVIATLHEVRDELGLRRAPARIRPPSERRPISVDPRAQTCGSQDAVTATPSSGFRTAPVGARSARWRRGLVLTACAALLSVGLMGRDAVLTVIALPAAAEPVHAAPLLDLRSAAPAAAAAVPSVDVKASLAIEEHPPKRRPRTKRRSERRPRAPLDPDGTIDPFE